MASRDRPRSSSRAAAAASHADGCGLSRRGTGSTRRAIPGLTEAATAARTGRAALRPAVECRQRGGAGPGAPEPRQQRRRPARTPSAAPSSAAPRPPSSSGCRWQRSSAERVSGGARRDGHSVAFHPHPYPRADGPRPLLPTPPRARSSRPLLPGRSASAASSACPAPPRPAPPFGPRAWSGGGGGAASAGSPGPGSRQ